MSNILSLLQLHNRWLTQAHHCLPQPVANDNNLPLLWRWSCRWCCSCDLSPIEQTHHMSNILSLLQLHNCWLTLAHRCLPQSVANDNNLPLLWRWLCYWCCSCGLSPIEQTHHMSNILSLLQLHNRWLTQAHHCLPQPVANDNNLPLLWRWSCRWCCSCGLSPIEQTHHMSNILSLLQLHNRWLTQAHRCLPQPVANDNNLPLLLMTMQNAINCFYQVLSSGQFLTVFFLHLCFCYIIQCTWVLVVLSSQILLRPSLAKLSVWEEMRDVTDCQNFQPTPETFSV